MEAKTISFLLCLAGLIISLQLLRGDMEQVHRENPLVFSRGVAITRKLGFPDVIMPGESLKTPPSGISTLNPYNSKSQYKEKIFPGNFPEDEKPTSSGLWVTQVFG